jgi:hypothetical protein
MLPPLTLLRQRGDAADRRSAVVARLRVSQVRA